MSKPRTWALVKTNGLHRLSMFKRSTLQRYGSDCDCSSKGIIEPERSQALLPKRKLKNLPHVRKAGVHLAPERCGPSKARKDRTQI